MPQKPYSEQHGAAEPHLTVALHDWARTVWASSATAAMSTKGDVARFIVKKPFDVKSRLQKGCRKECTGPVV